MDAQKPGSGSPGPEDRSPQADIARSSTSLHLCTHSLPQQQVSYVHALPRSKFRCAGFRLPRRDMPWPLQGTSGHIVTLVVHLVALCVVPTTHAAFAAPEGVMRACVAAQSVAV
jgi:hypothetical protein